MINPCWDISVTDKTFLLQQSSSAMGAYRLWFRCFGWDTTKRSRRFCHTEICFKPVQSLRPFEVIGFNDTFENRRGIIRALPRVLKDHCNGNIGQISAFTRQCIAREPSMRVAASGFGCACFSSNRDLQAAQPEIACAALVTYDRDHCLLNNLQAFRRDRECAACFGLE